MKTMRLAAWVLVVFLAGKTWGADSVEKRSEITCGQARFTVITPNLIRIEYAANGKFTDAPTLFATDRHTRDQQAEIRVDGDTTVIDTGEIRLMYHADGKPLTAANLSAMIKKKDRWSRWTPGMEDPQNLGGTLRTLDRISGPVDLGQGLISRSGWAVVDDSGTPVLTKDWVKSREDKAETDWYLFGYGLDYQAALRSLAAISGGVPLPRKNLLGVWYSRYWPYTSREFKQIVQQYADHGFPLDNIVMDMDWHITHFPGVKEEAWTGYTWNKQLIPDPPALLKWFHERGLFVTLNDHPAQGVLPPEAAYPAFMHAMGEDPRSGKTLPFDAGSKEYLDAFYATTHVPHEKEGVDFWWLDWQQEPNTRSVPDLQNLPWLNRYNFLRTSADDRRGVSFSRWGGWGDQKYPIHFSGDASTDWSMLAFEVPFTSTAGNVGCFFWTHDIGGHMGGRNEESYARWCQFGAMSASLRSHSTRKADMDRRPWTYPKWAEDSMRVSFRLRSELFPYIYTSAAESCEKMEPLLRPMYFEHPDVEDAYHNAQEYYFGDDLLVAPIAMPGVGPSRMAWQQVWFPQGQDKWFNFFTGEEYEPDTHTVVASDIDQFPLFVRGGVPLVMQPYTPRPATAALKHLVLRCYPGVSGAMEITTLYEDDGQTRGYSHEFSEDSFPPPPGINNTWAETTIEYVRDENSVLIDIGQVRRKYDGQPAKRSYTIELPCVQSVGKATLNHATPLKVSYDAATAIARIEVPEQPIGNIVQIGIEAKLLSPQIVHERAVAARLTSVTGHPIQAGNIKQMLVDALKSDDGSLSSALLAACGVEIYAQNDAPYLYGGHEVYRMHVTPGILDSAEGKAGLMTALPGEQAALLRPISITDNSTIDIGAMSEDLPAEDSIIVPGQEPKLHVVAEVNGQPCVMEMPVKASAPASLDLARAAKATASSATDESPPSGAIDGVVNGYPKERQHEWASNAEHAGATLTLTWNEPTTFSEVALYDRPNENDQVLAGRLVFDDGSAIPFGELANDGKTPTIVEFPSKTAKWMRVEITKVSDSTKYTGLAEVGVFK